MTQIFYGLSWVLVDNLLDSEENVSYFLLSSQEGSHNYKKTSRAGNASLDQDPE